MAFTIPDQAESDSDIQSILFQEDLEILHAGLAGIDCVLSGLAVTGGADMTPAVAKGAVLSNRVMFAVAAADVTITAADATNPRIDLIVVNSSGALAVRTGTPAPFTPGTSTPKPPARTANDVVIAFVYVPANDTAIATTQIVDKRATPNFPVCIYRTTTAETTNTTAAAINILDKTNAGVVIPNGLLLTGRALRVRIGGNYLINSGTPTITLAVIYGGTTMFADPSPVSVADVDRGAWTIDLIIMAQGNADQALSGFMILTPFAAVRGAATNGLGDLGFADASNRLGAFSFGGAAAVDSDTANRTLQVQWTYNVSNVADEVVVELATVELM
jgi:hypothetical protein